ncbi:MAG: lytic transglycosylase domain-containing protein, partial [Alphaproteobacteria bacterium]|nr:lytic transglycosylase domain-containing protein [Alphaproteobacteria bacterium]
RESGFDPKARAAVSSASGLYQFTADTWLRVVKVFGARHGLAEYREKIAVDAAGEVSMRDAVSRSQLLHLREEARLAALMAAELARDNKARLERLLGREATPTEIYLAHFLGLAAAAQIIAAAPETAAARLLPSAAAGNSAIFSPAGHDVSAGAILARIESYFAHEAPSSAGM